MRLKNLKVLQNILITYSRVNKRLHCNIKVTDMSHPLHQCTNVTTPPDENDFIIALLSILEILQNRLSITQIPRSNNLKEFKGSLLLSGRMETALFATIKILALHSYYL